MDNYLNHRWPQGPGVQPPPVPTDLAPAPKKRPLRRVRRWAVCITCVVVCLTLLAGVCLWAVNGIADALAGLEPRQSFDDPRPWNTRWVSSGSDWSPDDLPWGEPDPSVRLAAARDPGPAVTGREAYQAVLPALVLVEAAQPQDRWQSGGTNMGTGVILTDSGYVLTNYHIIDESVDIAVLLLDGRRMSFPARVIGFDEEFDLAVLKFDPKGLELTPAVLGDSDQLAVGDWVYAVGNPMGNLTASMSMGIVSALGRDEDAYGTALGLIQMDASINPGNSGGALLNESGQVVGITCSKVTGLVREAGESVDEAMVLEGMGFAIPITDALPFVNHILAAGESWRPYIGITCGAAERDGRLGILVSSVERGVPARAAGLREGDLIVSANGVPVTSMVELRRQIYRTGADNELDCVVVRDGAELPIRFALIDKPD